MKIAKLLNFISCYIIITSISGCVGNQNAASNSNDQLQTNNQISATKSLKGSSVQLEKVNAYEIYDHDKLNLNATISSCSKNNDVCIAIKSTPVLTWALGIGNKKQWINQEFPLTLYVTFPKGIDNNNFKLIGANQIPKSKGNFIANASEIDTSSCDNLVSTAHDEAVSCDIRIAIKGSEFTTDTDRLTLLFGDKSTGDYLTQISFPIKVEMSSIENIPILSILSNAIDSEYLAPNFGYDENSGALTYDRLNGVQLSNQGVAKVNGDNKSPSINPALSKSFDYESRNLDYKDAQYKTTCAFNDIDSGTSCFFNYWLKTDIDSSDTYTSSLGRFVFDYNNGSQIIHITKQVINSIGDFSTLNDTFTGNKLTLSKKIVGDNNTVQYLPEEKNLMIYAVVNNKFAIGFNTQTGVYSIDNSHKTITLVDQQSSQSNDLLKCLNTWPNTSEALNNGVINCDVNLSDNISEDLRRSSNLKLEIHAKYYSSVEQRVIDQIVGFWKLNEVINTIPGEYLNADYVNPFSTTYKDGIITLSSSKGSPTLDYDNECAIGSTVSVFRDGNRDARLRCDISKDLRAVPSGSYKSVTHDIGFDFKANILSAYIGDMPNYLDYNLCSDNSTVSVLGSNHPKLICDSYKDSRPSGQYLGLCQNIKYDVLTGKLSAVCKQTQLDPYRKDLELDYKTCKKNSTVSIRSKPLNPLDYTLSCDNKAELAPPGQYKNSCDNINWDEENHVLYASCPDVKGKIINTSLNFGSQCTSNSDVENQNGTLQCNSFKNGQPSGIYLGFCSEINFKDGTIDAVCKPKYESNKFKKMSLDYATQCSPGQKVYIGGLINKNLKCF